MEQYGGFWVRVVAYIIDVVLMAMVGAVIGLVFGGVVGASGGDMSDPSGGPSLFLNLISLIIGIAYFAGMESSNWQATVGKKAMGLIVTDTDGNKITFLRALGRYFAKILSGLILFIGYIMIAFTERKQGLHDMIASTLVMKGEPGMAGGGAETFE